VQRQAEHEADLVEEAYALTKAYYMTVYSSSRALHVHISKCPVVDEGDSDREQPQVQKGKRRLNSAAYGEC
jgi:hypothetical protein